jgi:hypothetical protein
MAIVYLTVHSVYLTIICSDAFLCVATKPVFLQGLQEFYEWWLRVVKMGAGGWLGLVSYGIRRQDRQCTCNVCAAIVSVEKKYVLRVLRVSLWS